MVRGISLAQPRRPAPSSVIFHFFQINQKITEKLSKTREDLSVVGVSIYVATQTER
jgi:hypothetical protein